MSSPVGVEKLTPGLIHPLVRMRTKVVPLGLKKVGRQHRIPIAIKERQCRAEGRDRNPTLRSRRYNIPPSLLRLLHLATEVVVQEQVVQLRILVVRLFDLSKET